MAAQLIDPYQRPIDYLRLSVTDRCDLRCSYCLPKGFKDFEEPERWLSFAEIERVVRAFTELGVRRVRLTGGEPLVRAELPELAERLTRLPGINDLSLSTNATRLLVDARRTRTPAATGDLVLRKEEEAYRVQDAVYAELWSGTRPVAWKVGGPSDKVDPTAAPIAPGMLLHSPASVAGASMTMIGVEAEVAFRLAKDLPPRSRPYSSRSVAAAVGEVLVTIELCDTRLANWNKASGLWMLADFQNSGGLVAGSGTKDWQKIDFLQQEVEFRIGARPAGVALRSMDISRAALTDLPSRPSRPSGRACRSPGQWSL